MVELPLNVLIYGFAFVDKLSELNLDEIHHNLSRKNVLVEKVIFSAWDDDRDSCTWVVAADRYLEDNEIKDTVDFIIDNEIEDEFLLLEYAR